MNFVCSPKNAKKQCSQNQSHNRPQYNTVLGPFCRCSWTGLNGKIEVRELVPSQERNKVVLIYVIKLAVNHFR